MYRLLEAAAAMTLPSGCQARWISFEAKSCCWVSAGATAGSGVTFPFAAAAALFALPLLGSPNLPEDYMHQMRDECPSPHSLDNHGAEEIQQQCLSGKSATGLIETYYFKQ